MYSIRNVGQQIFRRNHHQIICRTKSKVAVSKQSKILNRLIQGKRPTKKWHENDQILPSATSLSNDHGASKHISRRITVLNKLFMQHISDMLANGEWSNKIAGFGLEISQVKITSDFHLINVYWTAKNVENSDNLEATLQPIAIRIRHELSQLRLMGEVPRIAFVKDRTLSKLAEVDHLLAMADFGDDFVPTTPSNFRAQMIRKDFTETSESSSDLNDFQLPPMRHDVLGLNQLDIMNKIKQKMTKNRQAWEKYELQQSALTSKPFLIDNEKNEIDAKEILAKFLITKQYHRGTINRQRNRKPFDVPDFGQQNEYEDEDNDEDYDYIDEEYDDFKK